jgi:beta-aspartyl-peptidase (threonine type)
VDRTALILAASLVVMLLPGLGACGSGAGRAAAPPVDAASGRFAIAIHGGAGVIDRATTTDETRRAYEDSLRRALAIGRDELARGGTALDACEKVVRCLEDDPRFNAGKGAVFNADGQHELDASIMDGRTLACGAVAAVRTVKNPISLARLVMERTSHVMLIGDGAERFADSLGTLVDRVPNTYFDTPARRAALERALEEQRKRDATAPGRGTVGCVCLDTHGNLAAATSTGGMTAKRFGRVGDSPIIGAGTYASNRSCAVSCTGTGEEFIRHTAARDVAALMEYKGLSLQAAAEEVVFRRLAPDDGGLIAVSRSGEVALVFSTAGMFRGAADSSGRFEVAIWK